MILLRNGTFLFRKMKISWDTYIILLYKRYDHRDNHEVNTTIETAIKGLPSSKSYTVTQIKRKRSACSYIYVNNYRCH